MRGRIPITATAAALLCLCLVAAAPAAKPDPLARAALALVGKARARGAIDAPTAAAARGEIARASRLSRLLPRSRSDAVRAALGQLVALGGLLNEPRATTLVGQLEANDDYFALHAPPAPKTDVVGRDGVVYRYFAGRCLEFHPLADMGALNAAVAANDAERTQVLADALVARAVTQGNGGLAWEYEFPYANGRAPWRSGMAQAVAAQAFERAATVVPDHATVYETVARRAYRAIAPSLLTSVAAGPWIRLYSFDATPVLNAQLQTVLSLRSYADAAGDAGAEAFADRMQQSAAASLPRFDTGYWTHYSLAGDPTPIDYETYVTQLLQKLAPADARFAAAATRIAGYAHQPPAFVAANASLGSIRFWLSKPSTIVATSAAGPTRVLASAGGTVTTGWAEPKRPGVYPVHVSARDYAGNRAQFDALPIVRASATAAKGGSVTSSGALGTPSFAVGAVLADATHPAAANALGLRLARVGVAWPAGASVPDPGLVTTLQRIPARLGLLVDLTVPVPLDPASRVAFAQYAAALATSVPGIRALVLAPTLSVAAAADEAADLVALRTAVQLASPGVAVAISLDGATAPAATVAALGAALRALGATTPALDAVVFRPAPAAARGAWTAASVPAIDAALGSAPALYLDLPGPAALAQESCDPTLAGVILDDTTGVTPAAVAAAQRGTTVCPGATATAAATTLAWPASLTSNAPVQVTLGCGRDCLYLVTLERANRTPVVAARGSAQGGGAPLVVALPRAALATGSYTAHVLLVATTNPGAVADSVSPPLSVG